MPVLFNIGNSNTQVACASENGELSRFCVFPTRELGSRLPEFSGEFAVASVVREWNGVFPAGTFFLTSATSAVNLELVDSTTLGADRIANAVEAAARGVPPVAVIDCGTAITFEVVDGAGRFRGGAILPGRRLAREALHDKTSQLPILPWSSSAPAHCGIDTSGSMAFGIDRGAVGAVRELMNCIAADFPGVRFLAVGGDRAIFLAAIAGLQDGGSDFTLRGLFRAWRAEMELRARA